MFDLILLMCLSPLKIGRHRHKYVQFFKKNVSVNSLKLLLILLLFQMDCGGVRIQIFFK